MHAYIYTIMGADENLQSTFVHHIYMQLAQETSTPRQGNLFVIRFPNVGSSGQFAYVDTYNNVLRYGSDDDKLGLSGKSIFIAIQNLFLCHTHIQLFNHMTVTCSRLEHNKQDTWKCY